MEKKQPRQGMSYKKRIADVNRIYDAHAKSGLSNREIWRRFVYPHYAISERTFYNLLKASAQDDKGLNKEEVGRFLFPEYFR